MRKNSNTTLRVSQLTRAIQKSCNCPQSQDKGQLRTEAQWRIKRYFCCSNWSAWNRQAQLFRNSANL